MTTPDPVLSARSRVATAARLRDPLALDTARQDLKTAKVAKAIREAIDSAPPITDAQRAQLSRLLLAGGANK